MLTKDRVILIRLTDRISPRVRQRQGEAQLPDEPADGDRFPGVLAG